MLPLSRQFRKATLLFTQGVTRMGPGDLSNRLSSLNARQGGRKASIQVREKLAEQWE